MFKEFRKNVREFWQEEPFDFFFYRFFAYLIVRATYRLPLNPNHFSLLGLITAILTGVTLAEGTRESFILGGLGIFLFGVFDCCDGLLARMKGNGTKYGALIDMVIDVISALSFYSGVTIGLVKSSEVFTWELTFPVLSMFAIAAHAGIYHFYKKQFVFFINKDPKGFNNEIEQYRKEYEELKEKNGSLIDRILILFYLKLNTTRKENPNIFNYEFQSFISYNKKTVPLWGVIAGSSHLTILSYCLIMNNLDFYFYYALIFGNLWVVMMTMVQKIKLERIEVIN